MGGAGFSAKIWRRSPSTISRKINKGRLKLSYPEDERMHVSHETIYRRLFVQTRGLLGKDLRNHLRSTRKFRHAKGHKPGSGQKIFDGVSIRDRPADVEDRAVPEHWEADRSYARKWMGR